MQNEHAGTIRGLSIAAIILSALAALGCIAALADIAMGGHIIRSIGPSGFEYYYQHDSDFGSAMNQYGITNNDLYNLTQWALLFGGFVLTWEIICSIAAIIAGIIGIRNAQNTDKLRLVMIWAIVGAVAAFLSGRVITMVLFILAAVFAYRDQKAAQNPYAYYRPQPPYGQPGPGAAYGQGTPYYANPANGGYAPYQQPGNPYGQPYGQSSAQPYSQAAPNGSPFASTAAPYAPDNTAATTPETAAYPPTADGSTPSQDGGFVGYEQPVVPPAAEDYIQGVNLSHPLPTEPTAPDTKEEPEA